MNWKHLGTAYYFLCVTVGYVVTSLGLLLCVTGLISEAGEAMPAGVKAALIVLFFAGLFLLGGYFVAKENGDE
jgi:hypothetical protein